MAWLGISEQVKESFFTLGGIFTLSLPCLASRLPSDSDNPLSGLQSLGGPFAMRNETLGKHFAFSPRNLEDGRLYTLVTSIFNHGGMDHFIGNMSILIPVGHDVHRRFGRKHFLAAFIGGGVAGNLAQLAEYVYQQLQWQEVLPSPYTWSIFGESFNSTIESWQKGALGSVYTSVNAWRASIGASAALSGLVAIQACANIRSLISNLQELRIMRRTGVHDRHREHILYMESLYQLSHLFLTTLVVYEDASRLIDSTSSDKGILRTLVAYSSDGIGHAAHIGGFLFGVLYFFCILS
ncbi:predicted protein [Nematostella vectensis]|uniref:rhomboid protease n=1 Tax=Nematostella vectensis TaxID=45351 RepID=A7RLQ1_NEMVE|nr:predicted protein [Nematostella vectensis]|eukprot:XP_001639794.1 predicted protein [Nematostella vectensis]